MPAFSAAFLLADYIPRLMPEKNGHGLLLVNEMNTHSKLLGFLIERNVRQGHMYFIKTPKYEEEDILSEPVEILNQCQKTKSIWTSS